MTNRKTLSEAPAADLLAWQDLARRRDVGSVRSLILLAIERQLTLGIYAEAWCLEYGRTSPDEDGEVAAEFVEGDQTHTGFVELPSPVLESLLGAETVTLDYLYRDDEQFSRVTGRVVGGALVNGSVSISRDNLCGRVTKPGPATTQFKPPGPEHSAKKEEGNERLIAVVVELYRREKANKPKSLYLSDTHGVQARIVADIEGMLDKGALSKYLLSRSTLKTKIGKAFVKIKELGEGV